MSNKKSNHTGLSASKRFVGLFFMSLLLLVVFCVNNPVDDGDDNLIFGTMTDLEGNVYKTIKIGNQEWMAENLRTTKYADGSSIAHLTNDSAWGSCISTETGAYCFYNNTTNADSIERFGALYNWFAVDSSRLAPAGWHVPSDAEWDTLEIFLIANGYNWDETTSGDKTGKSLAAKTDWEVYTEPGTIGNDLSKNNRSGFSAVPGGSRSSDGAFGNIGTYGDYWSATETSGYSWYRDLFFRGNSFDRYYGNQNLGFSVRLVRSSCYLR